ncbi:hypothetical protein BGZ51_003633 [Haplosporangium sp. Z 767]|nr:hypothetical protein BGZ51_003633 [Haplosporangium sp. Z 767]KAF9188595.1 hypothetical protein BGZ50_001248 [Haplosporangium sp. Z 11]
MLKKLGLQTRDSDLSSHTIIATTSPTTAAATTSLKDSKLLEREWEKKKAHHNKKVLQSSRRVSYDSIESESVTPQPHLPSSVYSPNPFPLDPTQPDGVSRYNAFLHIRGHDTREVEAVDIEIEETKGFVSGRSRNSVELDRADAQRHHNDDNDDDDDLKYELSKKAHSNTIQKLGVGLKGAFAKSGLGRSREKNRETEKDRVIMDMEKGKANSQPVDAVLQHHLQLQEQHLQQEQLYSEEEVSMLPPLPRGRDRERQRPISLDNYDDDRDYFVDKKTRLHSLSPPPAPGQEGRHSRTYWPEGHRGLYSDYQEQMSPFLGYQPPPHTGASSRYHRYQKQQYQSRAYKQAADLGYDSSPSRYERERRTQYRERSKSDRIQREPARGGARGGIRRHTGLSHVTNAASPVSRTSSEFADDEDVSSVSATNDRVDHQQQQRQVPDRLSRAKEWVASHNKNNNVAVPAPVMDREAALSSLPGAFPRRPSHRRSLDSDDYVLMTPPRRSYQGHAGGGYDSRERMAMMAQMQMHGVQRSRRDSMGDDGRYWSHQLEGYERDRHRQSRAEYEYERRGGFHGYASGGPDDVDEDESGSTLAPGSAIVGASLRLIRTVLE